MNRTYTRYIVTSILAVSLVAPAQAFDLRLWFNNSRNAFYVGAAATVVAGLSFLAYSFCFKKKAKAVATKNADVQTDVQSSRIEELISKNVVLEQENGQLKSAALKQNEDMQGEAKHRAQQKEDRKQKIKEAQNKIAQLKVVHAQVKQDTALILKEYWKDVQSAASELLQETQDAFRYEQGRQIAKFVNVLDQTEVDDIVWALENKKYGRLTPSKELLLTSWPQHMRDTLLERLKRKQEAIEKNKKKVQQHQAAFAKKQQVKQEAEAVSVAMDKAIEKQQESKPHKARAAIAKPVTRKSQVDQ